MKKLLKWLIPILFLALGIFCFTTVHGHGFLGILSCGIAAVITVYFLIGLLRRHSILAAKVLNTILTFLLCLGVFAFAFTEYFILQGCQGSGEGDFDYLIVLGAKVNGTEPSFSLNDRIQAAYEYLAAHPDMTAILSGGKGSDESISEAQCMYNMLTGLGISPQRLWLEEQATSTWENLQFSLKIIEEKIGKRPDTVGVLSSEYHLYRAGLFAREWGVEATLIPAETSWPTIRLNYALREVPVLWKHLLFGG